MADGNRGRSKARDILGISPEQEEADRTAVSSRLIAFRNVLGLNQTEFYTQAGLPSNNGSHYERGSALPSLTFARALCRRHGMSMDYLYEGKLAALPADKVAAVEARLRIVAADLKDRLDMERRANERAGLGYVSNQRLQNEKESQRTRDQYQSRKQGAEEANGQDAGR